MKWYAGCVVLLSVVVSAPLAEAQTCPVPRSSVETALLHRTCGTQGIPAALVRTVIRVESGGHPYALRINAGRGHAFYPTTYPHAVQMLQAVLPITRNIDLGLMQINWATWGEHLGMPAAQLLDPVTNLRVGCWILRQALTTRGPLWQRLGRYHSGRRARQWAYAQRVLRQLTHVRTSPTEDLAILPHPLPHARHAAPVTTTRP